MTTVMEPGLVSAIRAHIGSSVTSTDAWEVDVTPEDAGIPLVDATVDAIAATGSDWLTPEESRHQVWQTLAGHAVEKCILAAQAEGPGAITAELAGLVAMVVNIADHHAAAVQVGDGR